MAKDSIYTPLLVNLFGWKVQPGVWMAGYEISGNKTGLFCIIGMPGRHSLSPAMHNAGFKKLGIDAVFLAFDVPKEKLKSAVEGMRAYGMKGMTLTSPHKLEVMKYIDRIDPTAKRIGAVNTLVNTDGFIKGYNTDAAGFYESIRATARLEGRKFVIIGAGGAARAFSFAIAEKVRNPSIAILNRHPEKAKRLAAEIRGFADLDITSGGLDAKGMEKAMDNAYLIANATNITLENSKETPVPKRFLKRGMVVFDANYVPLENRLLVDAKSVGCRTISGLDLLLYQGLAAFRLFTGKTAPVEEMRKALLAANSRKDKDSG